MIILSALKSCPEPLDAPAVLAQGFFSHLHKTPADTEYTQVEMWTHAEIWQKAVALQKSWDKAKAPK